MTPYLHSDGRSGVVLFGGAAAHCGSPAIRDSLLWFRTDTTWHPIAAAGGPAAREDALMAFDPDSRSLFLYGGRDGATVYEDTWQYRQGQWRRLAAAGGPGKVEHPAIAFDPRRKVLVVFGGGTRANPRTPSAATWEWNGTGWSNVTSSASPAGRVAHSMTWSPTLGVLLYGGFSPAGAYRDLWRRTGSGWDKLSDAGPADTEGPALISTSKGLLLLAQRATGSGATRMAAWRYHGPAWVLLADGGPATRIGQVSALDSARSRVVVLGGVREGDNQLSPEIWQLDLSTSPPTWTVHR
ncbi:MAG: hypothetical protein ACKVZ0_04355 [Gemmatimonadales bacterium]